MAWMVDKDRSPITARRVHEHLLALDPSVDGLDNDCDLCDAAAWLGMGWQAGQIRVGALRRCRRCDRRIVGGAGRHWERCAGRVS